MNINNFPPLFSNSATHGVIVRHDESIDGAAAQRRGARQRPLPVAGEVAQALAAGEELGEGHGTWGPTVVDHRGTTGEALGTGGTGKKNAGKMLGKWWKMMEHGGKWWKNGGRMVEKLGESGEKTNGK